MKAIFKQLCEIISGEQFNSFSLMIQQNEKLQRSRKKESGNFPSDHNSTCVLWELHWKVYQTQSVLWLFICIILIVKLAKLAFTASGSPIARSSVVKNGTGLTLTVLKRKYLQPVTMTSDTATQISDSVRERRGNCLTRMDRWMNRWKNNKLY